MLLLGKKKRFVVYFATTSLFLAVATTRIGNIHALFVTNIVIMTTPKVDEANNQLSSITSHIILNIPT